MSMYPQGGYQPNDYRQQPQAQGAYLDYAKGETSIASFMNQVYAWMCAGLAATGVVAWYTASSGLWKTIFSSGMFIALIVAELGLVFAISYATKRISATMASILFFAYSAINGLTLSVVFLAYTNASIAGTFAATAGMFGVMSVYGYVTKRDLTKLGSLLFMALIGLVIASVVNIFVASSWLYWLVTYAGILIFVGLTAYDTQKIKEIGYQTGGNAELASRMAIVGSLSLYLDFINLFLLLLRLMGDRRN